MYLHFNKLSALYDTTSILSVSLTSLWSWLIFINMYFFIFFFSIFAYCLRKKHVLHHRRPPNETMNIIIIWSMNINFFPSISLYLSIRYNFHIWVPMNHTLANKHIKQKISKQIGLNFVIIKVFWSHLIFFRPSKAFDSFWIFWIYFKNSSCIRKLII